MPLESGKSALVEVYLNHLQVSHISLTKGSHKLKTDENERWQV